MIERELEGFRLSPQQTRAWRSGSENAPQVAQCAILTDGPLQPDTLQSAVRRIVDRHEILRTRYVRSPGIKLPFQVVMDRANPIWETHDWTDVSPSQQSAQIDQFFEERLQLLPPDLESESFLRFALMRLTAERHILIVSVPSLSADSITLDNLLHELATSYDACATGQAQNGTVLQYADYGAWIEELAAAEDEDARAAVAYWRTQPRRHEPLNLPFQYPGKAERGANLAYVRSDLGIRPETLDQASREEGASTSDFLFACSQILIGRLAASQRVTSAVRLTCRGQEELRDAFGMFARWAPIHTDLANEATFRNTLASIKAAARDAERWQEYFLEGEQPEPSIAFEYDEWPRAVSASAGISFSMLAKRIPSGNFSLRLSCQRTRDVTATWYYDPESFVREDIERVADHFRAAIQSAIRSRDTAISRLTLLTPGQRDRIVVGFNPSGEGCHTPLPECIHERFQEQARRTPDRIALVCEDRQITYRELDERSDRLAGVLTSLGVGPETFAAIYLGRSSHMVVALFGVLKAGGAYVPLDPGLPVGRLKTILADTRPRVVLTVSAARHELPEVDGHIVCLDEEQPLVSSEWCTPSSLRRTTGTNLVYVLFTSGSTGVPKGVTVEHRQLANYVEAISEALDLPTGASYACVSTFAADLGHTAVFPPLCSGGTLHVISQDRVTDPDAFAEYFSKNSIDCLKIVPSHLHALLSASHPARVLPKRRLVLGGDAASWPLIRRIQELAPECVVFNHYGPTETTVGASTYQITAEAFDERTGSVPIGRPIATAKMYVLDPDLEPVPVWMPGEIHIGGGGLARGYLNGPDATAEKFIPSPFDSGARLYRTGDIGRYLPNGAIEFLGRRDHQVKIRGFRVELGEIESVLQQHPGVRQAIVLLREDVPGEKQIAAYVASDDRSTLNPDALRGFVKSKLPEQMVPSLFFVLDALPLTPNGKVDRSRLLQFRTQTRSEPAHSRAVSPLESRLLSIFAEVLRLPNVEVDSNFFDSGGHSLLAVQILSRIRRELKIDLPMRVLFETPTVEGIAAAVAKSGTTSPSGRGPFERDVTGTDGEAEAESDERVRIPKRKAGDPVPLSSTQEQMWFLDQLAPGSASYNMAYAFRLRGTLNITALERAFNEIVGRHEILRTTFESVEGVPRQVIAESLTIAVPVVPVPELSVDSPSDEATRLASEHARQPFDLARGPLLRCRLLKVDDREHVLLIATHHIVNDGWSWTVMFSEVAALYHAFDEGRLAALPELPLQYGDFARWEGERLRSGLLDERLAYWMRQLTGAPTLLELPTDRPLAAVQSLRGTVHTEMFPLDLKKQLETLSREEGATLFMTLCAAFNTLLWRWTGQEDIVVGSTIAGRNLPELEPLIGLFINTLVLRTSLSGNPTFRELLGRVREAALGAYANPEVPFDKLIERLHSTRSLSHGTLFQVLFVLHQGTSQQELSLAGLTVERVPLEIGAVKFALSTSMVDKPDGLSCSITYQTDLFDGATIRRLVVLFRRLLDAIVRDPNLRLSQLPLLSDTERRQMLVTWNDTSKDYPTDACIHELFAHQVQRTPDAYAVMLDAVALTYRELDRRASAVARRLREAGARPGDCIVLCIDRSVEMLVGVIGILKAGCAYVPIDAQHSLERLPFVLEDIGARLLLTGRRLAPSLSSVRAKCGDLTVMCLDDPAVIEHRQPMARHSVRVTSDELAYVIYTSGSTGTPKGVEITHRSLTNFALSSAETFALKPGDRVLQFASLSFDTAVEEIFPTLITGATLVLRTDRMLDSASRFLDHCRRWRISVIDLPTVYWHELTETIVAENLELPPPLRLAILGGDRALPERAAQWQRRSKGRVRLLNEYGPTEATVVATTHEVTDDGFGTELPELPIGRPIANVQTYILDDELNPVPIGARGALYVGGIGVARGYRRRPDLTAESFVPNPFSQRPGERLYKTGDLARYLANGSIEFLGRTDHQVKVRGFRVEPAEIEAVLAQHAGVRHLVVVPRQVETGDHQLIAYVVAAPGVQLTAEALREFLKGRLPQYMIPSAFEFLSALPLTPHGKVDRRALPDPDPQGLDSHDTYVAPRTPMERAIGEEWEQLLGTGPVGVRDNFFELGGHSLLAVRLIARIEKRFGRPISVAVLFESPTVEQLARRLEQQTDSTSWSSLIAVQPLGSKPPFFWVHGDHSVAILPAFLGSDQPVYGLEHQSQDGRPARYTRVEDIAAHYVREVRSARPRGPYLLGGYSFGAVVAFEMAQQLRAAGEQVDILFLLDPPGKLIADESIQASDEMRRHRREMASLSLAGKLHYLRLRVQARLHQYVGSRAVKRINDLRVKLSLAMEQPIPAPLRSQYILGVYAQALREYIPQRYAGPVTLVRANDVPYKPRLDWTRLIATEPRILHFEGGHTDLRIEPHVGVWAQLLKELLDCSHAAEHAHCR